MAELVFWCRVRNVGKMLLNVSKEIQKSNCFLVLNLFS